MAITVEDNPFAPNPLLFIRRTWQIEAGGDIPDLVPQPVAASA